MKLKFDSTSIDNKIIPSLNKTKANLLKTANTANYVIPGDCAYSNYLRSLNSRIKNLGTRTKSLETWLKTKSKNSDTITEDSLNEILRIQTIEIKRK